MAAGPTAQPVNDWQTVDPGDWQTLPAATGGSAATGGPGVPNQIPPVSYVSPTGQPMSDAEHSRILAGQQADTSENSGLSQIGPGLRQAWNGPDMRTRAAGLSQAIRGAAHAGTGALMATAPLNPIGTAAALGAGAAGAFLGGKTVGAVTDSPEYQHLGQDIGGLAAGSAAASSIGGRASNATHNFFNVDPDTALWQAVQPRTSAQDFLDMGPTVRGDIKSAAGSRSLSDVPSTKRAVGAAKAINRAVMDMHLDPYRQSGVQIPGGPIGDAIESSIPLSEQIEAQTDPAAAQRIEQTRSIADAYRQKMFSVDELRQLAIETNADLNGFYHKTADARNAVLSQQGGQAALEARAAAIRQIMRQNFGDDVANLQQRWGWLDDVDAGLDTAYKKVLNQKPPSAADAAFRMTGAPGKILHGDVEGARYALGSGKINSLLKRAFEQTEPSGPLPTPGPSGMGPGGMPTAAPPGRQLPPGTPQLQPPISGYVRSGNLPPEWQANIWQNIGGRRLLGPGRPGMGEGEPPPGEIASRMAHTILEAERQARGGGQ